MSRQIGAARDALQAYQSRLDALGLSCEHVRRADLDGPMPAARCVALLVVRAALAVVLLLLAVPGLLLCLPVWLYLYRFEKRTIAKGPRWADSLAETKMMIGGLYGMGVVVLGALGSLALRAPYPVLAVAYLNVALRCYEEGFACARSARTLATLLVLPDATLRELIESRALTRAALDSAMGLLDAPLRARLAKAPQEARAAAPFAAFFRRRKRDWNELLRLRDHATMDYVH